jgi:outer membrane receptor protein involved in Fe transport
MKKKSVFKLGSLALAIAVASAGIHSAELEEITVTAQKRAENLQDVPISMTALDGERIEEAGITSFTDLSTLAPNLLIAENAVNSIITMRGISVGSNQSFEQSVGIYTDGIHYGKSRQIRTGLFDVSQVEVLRGPQGILFGKNTLAGAINVTTAEPVIGEPNSGALAMSQERYDGTILEGNFNAALTENLSVRIAFRDNESDGYMNNGFPSANVTMPTTDENIWRLSSVWQPNDSTTVKLKHTESDYVRLGGAATITTFEPVDNLETIDGLVFAAMNSPQPELGGASLAQIMAPSLQNQQPFRDSISYGGCALSNMMGIASRCNEPGYEKPEGTNTSTDDTSLSVNIDMDGGYTFTSVTGISGYSYEDGIDADFLPLQFAGRSDISTYEQKSQEFRIASPKDNKFSFITGAYYTSSEQEIDRLVAIDGTIGNPAAVLALAGAPTGLAFNLDDVLALNAATGLSLTPGVDGETMFNQAGRISNWVQETDSWAVFFQGTYQLRDDLSFTAGLRYTEEDKAANAMMALTTSYNGEYDNLAIPYVNLLALDNVADITERVTGLNTIFAQMFDSYPHNFSEQRSTDQLIPAANLQWEPSDDNKYYISYSEGFKSGGFNAADDQNPTFNGLIPNPTEPGPGFEYDDENAKSWEIGGKHTLMSGSMNFNWAIFDSVYDNQQVSTFDGLGFVVTNAASSNISGLEVDMAWQATENLRLGANFALLDGEYDQFLGAACTAIQSSDILGGAATSGACAPNAQGQAVQNLSGGKLGADHSGSFTVDYEYPMSNGAVWFTSADYYMSDDQFLSGDNDPIDSQEAFDRVNFRTGIRTDDWDVMLYGRNITDEITTSGAADVPNAGGAHFKYLQPGEVWGARFKFRF